MIDAAVLDAMLAAGCSAEQIVATVKASILADHDAEAARRETDRLRKRRQREREANSMVASEMSRGQTVTSSDTVTIPSPPPSLSPDKEIPPTPPKENNLFPEPSPQPRVSGARALFEERFWPIYPNKVGKADALKAFDRALKRVDFETMMTSLDRYVHKTDDRPWCNPSTWLNQDRWDDQPSRASPQARARPLRGLAAVTEVFMQELAEDGYAGQSEESGDHHDDARLPLIAGPHHG